MRKLGDDFETLFGHFACNEKEAPRRISIISGNGIACILRSPFLVVFALKIPDLAPFHLRDEVDAVLAVAFATKGAGADDALPDFLSRNVEHDLGLGVEKVAEEVLERVPSECRVLKR